MVFLEQEERAGEASQKVKSYESKPRQSQVKSYSNERKQLGAKSNNLSKDIQRKLMLSSEKFKGASSHRTCSSKQQSFAKPTLLSGAKRAQGSFFTQIKQPSSIIQLKTLLDSKTAKSQASNDSTSINRVSSNNNNTQNSLRSSLEQQKPAKQQQAQVKSNLKQLLQPALIAPFSSTSKQASKVKVSQTNTVASQKHKQTI